MLTLRLNNVDGQTPVLLKGQILYQASRNTKPLQRPPRTHLLRSKTECEGDGVVEEKALKLMLLWTHLRNSLEINPHTQKEPLVWSSGIPMFAQQAEVWSIGPGILSPNPTKFGAYFHLLVESQVI